MRDGLAIVAVAGELDRATAPEVSKALTSLAERDRVVLVDLSGIEFVDCAGIALLARAWRRQRELGGELVLDVSSEAVSKLIERTKLDREITLASSAELERHQQVESARQSSIRRS